VHEAYFKLVGGQLSQLWNSRGHFFGAAAEAMRRIIVDDARHKSRQRHGGDLSRIDFDKVDFGTSLPPNELIAISDLLEALAKHDPTAAELVKLQFFAGFSVEEAAEALGISRSSAYRQWAYARAWLIARMEGNRISSEK
jgi:RNA polymerase sigma factor (TIGR02999 family)